MIRRNVFALGCALACGLAGLASDARAQSPVAPAGRTAAQGYNFQDWSRFYHYPYVWYPQNFWGNDYYRSAESLYFRYPPEMRIPVYNRKWHNEYPQPRRYHQGSQFILDTF
jgi:hypothetical protein